MTRPTKSPVPTLPAADGNTVIPTTYGDRIRALHLDAQQHAQAAVERALEAGRLLNEVKAKLPHGEFGSWVATHCGFTQRSATRYMRLYASRNVLPADVTVTKALATLAKADRLSFLDRNPNALEPDRLHSIFLEDGSEALVAPSSEHPGFMHVGVIIAAGDGGTLVTTKRPIRLDAVHWILDREFGTRWRAGRMESAPCPEGYLVNPLAEFAA